MTSLFTLFVVCVALFELASCSTDANKAALEIETVVWSGKAEEFASYFSSKYGKSVCVHWNEQLWNILLLCPNTDRLPVPLPL